MKPSHLSDSLRKIASRLDNSVNPDKRLVIASMRSVLAQIEDYGPPHNLPPDREAKAKVTLKVSLPFRSNHPSGATEDPLYEQAVSEMWRKLEKLKLTGLDGMKVSYVDLVDYGY